MNTIRLIVFLLLHSPALLYAQIDWGEYSQSFPDEALDNPRTVALILAIPKRNNSFWIAKENSDHFHSYAKDPASSELRLAGPVARTTFDTARAQFFLHGVGKRNAGDYQFRVMEYPGRRVIAPWQSVTQFTDSNLIKSSTLPQMAYLGGYRAPLGSMLIMDVRQKGKTPIIATSLVAWEKIRPTVSNLYTSADLDVFLQKLQYPWARSRTDNQTRYSTLNPRLPATNTNLVYLLNAHIYAKNQVQYQLTRNDEVILPWHDNEYDNSFIWLKGFEPGQYRIRIRYAVQPQHVSEYTFEIEPTWSQSTWFKVAMIGVILIVVGFVVFVILLIRQQRKTRQEMANKQKLNLELRALYAQLNPHFIFNALSSIQSLVNQQDLKAANEYLSDFARLMRESLTNSGKEETSLYQELQTIETYLKLEQLRFGFHYTIQVSEQLDMYTTSLPSLVWQPLLENAVKHGVAPLQQNGQVMMLLDRQNDDLIIQITDNGKGIPCPEPTNGFGLKLTRDRIRLLNSLNPAQPITLAFKKTSRTGTDVTLTFSCWLA